jgi:protein-S-isoprenylcysteine O-methyltransferase Ste14
MDDIQLFNRIALVSSVVLFSLLALIFPMIRHRLTGGEGSGFVIRKVTDPMGKFIGVIITLQTFGVMVWCIAFALLGPGPLAVWTFFPVEVSYLGILLIGASQLLVVTAQAQMGKAWRMCIDEDQKKSLVTHGLFSVVRNPIYLGTIVLVTGVFLLSPSPWSLWLISNAIIFVSLQARLEEDFLLRTHGKQYLEYASRVGRFFPGLGRINQSPDTR